MASASLGVRAGFLGVYSRVKKNLNQNILLSKIGFDAAENEPAKVCDNSFTVYNYNNWFPHLRPSFICSGRRTLQGASTTLSIKPLTRSVKKFALFSPCSRVHHYSRSNVAQHGLNLWKAKSSMMHSAACCC